MLPGHTQSAEPPIAILAKRDRAAILSPAPPDASLNDRLTRIEDAPLFCGLSLAECTSIFSIARERCFSSQQMIFREGDPACCIFFLAAGRVKLTHLSRTGVQLLLRVVDRGEVVGELGLPAGRLHTLTAQTLESCRVLTWDAGVFETLCERMPALARNSLRILADLQHVLEERFLELITERTPSRLARLLVRLLEQSGCSIHRPARIEGLLREHLAQMIGATMYTVSRLLCQWEKLGILETQRGALVIRNPSRLIQFADAIRTNDPRADSRDGRSAGQPQRAHA
jgi:CRP/FNR family transcriptional regulator, nitrogen oxide reductase regulator